MNSVRVGNSVSPLQKKKQMMASHKVQSWVRYYLLLSLVPNSITGIEGSKLLMIFYALEYYRDTLQV